MLSFQFSETKKKVLSNLVWAVAGKTINLAGTLVLGIIVARYLGPEQYGLMNYVFSYVFLFQVLACFGLDNIEIREEAKAKIPYTIIIGTAFWLKMVFGVICILLSVGTAWIMSEDSYTIGLIAIYSIYIVFNGFVVIRNYFTSIVENKYIVISEIFRTFVGILIKVVLLLLNSDLTWFVVAFAFDWLLLAGGYLSSYRKKVGRLSDWTFSMSCAKYMLKESLPLLITNAAVIIYQRIDQVMIGQLLNNKANVGFFSVAAKFVEVMIFIPATLANTVSPVLVRLRNHNESDYVEKSQQFMNISLWLSIIVSVGVSVISYWLILLTFGKDYLPAVAILQVLAFKMAATALSNTAGTMLIVEGLQKWVFFRDSLGCIACVILNYCLLPRYGVIASAFVAIIANITAGYIADAIIPAYRHLFWQQTKAIFIGWRDLIHIKALLAKK